MTVIACGGNSAPPKTSLADTSAQTSTRPTQSPPGSSRRLPAAALVALDSGNVLYRAKRYDEALAQYRLAATRAPDDASAYFGVWMVADITQNKLLADSAAVALRARGMEPPTSSHGSQATRPK